MFFKVAQKVNKYLGILSEKLCHQILSKIAQSGHTGGDVPNSIPITCGQSYYHYL